MKIIKTGVAPGEREYFHRCHSCGTEFTFYLKDVSHEDDYRERDSWWTCKCPHPPCNTAQYIRTLTPYAK